MGIECSTHEEKMNSCRILVRKPKRERTLGRPRCMCEDNIKIYPREIRCGGMDLIGLTQDRNQWRALVNTVMNLQVP
jgi:hypothetical protein